MSRPGHVSKQAALESPACLCCCVRSPCAPPPVAAEPCVVRSLCTPVDAGRSSLSRCPPSLLLPPSLMRDGRQVGPRGLGVLDDVARRLARLPRVPPPLAPPPSSWMDSAVLDHWAPCLGPLPPAFSRANAYLGRTARATDKTDGPRTPRPIRQAQPKRPLMSP